MELSEKLKNFLNINCNILTFFITFAVDNPEIYTLMWWNEKWLKEKLGNYLIDVSKWLISAGMLSSAIQKEDPNSIYYLVMGIITALLALAAGLILISESEQNKNIRKESK